MNQKPLAKSSNPPVGFPSAGDRNAPPGSPDWAIAVRLDILNGLSESSSTAEHLERLVSLFRQHSGWRHLPGPDGQPFSSYEAFCVAPQLNGGLGYDAGAIDQIVRERRTAQFRAQQPAQLQQRGTNQGGSDIITSSGRGTHADYLIARLARDYPDILAALQRGEYSSVRQAALAAGIAKQRIQLEPTTAAFARAARRHLTPDQLRELADALLDEEVR